MGLGMPIPDLSNKPGPGRPGWGPTGAYEFQFEVDGQVTIKAHAASGGGSFTIKWPNGSSQSYSGNNGTIVAPDATAGIVAINNKLDTGYCDEFAVTGGKDKVKKVISWGERPWRKLSFAFSTCPNLTNIENTKLIGAANCNIEYLFFNCAGLTEALCENWDLSLGCEMRYLFESCTNLELLNLTGSKLPSSGTAASNYSFHEVGSTTTNGCEFKMSGLDFTGTVNAPGRQWFKLAKFKDGSNLSNWTFDSALNSFYATDLFTSATVNGTLDVSGWNWPSQQFPSFNSVNSSLTSQNGSKIKLTNFDVSNVNDFASAFVSCKVYELEGLSTWGACAGNASIYRMFSGATLMRINPNDNLSNTFVASLTPPYVHEAFNNFGGDLQDSELGVCPNLNGLDLSNLLSSDAFGLKSFMRNHKSTNTPDFSNVTFSSTNTVGFDGAFRSFKTTGTGSDSIFNFNPITVKPANFQSTWYFAQGVTEVNIGSNVDMSSMTSVSAMLYAINYNASATPFTNATFPTNADFSSLTNFSNFVNFAQQVLSVCQMDNFIRRLRATNNNSNITVDFHSCKITEAPALVRSDINYFTNTKGWNITLATPDATLPFAYASYAVDPTGITTISPTVTPPAGSVFTATNGLSISASGVITIGSFRGGSTIRCTYPDGCYNEVVMLIQVPFVMRTVIPGLVGSTTYLDMEVKPQMSAGECFVDWGDSNSQTLTGNTTHTYASAGTYDIKIFDSPSGSKFENFSGYFPVYTGLNGATYGSTYDIDIIQWGEIQWKNPSVSGQGWFALGSNQKSYIELAAASDNAPDLSQATSLRKMFGTSGGGAGQSDIARFTDPNDSMRSWNTSTITDMSEMWKAKLTDSSISLDLSQWDVSNVETFASMFDSGSGNQQSSIGDLDISGWNTQSATNMSRMFYRTSANSVTGLGDLNTSSVTTMSQMFNNASSGVINQSSETLATKMVNGVLRWDVNNVTSFSSMFYDANGLSDTTFPTNWNISSDASKTVSMSSMFGGTPSGLTGVTNLDAFATKTINETWYGGTSYTAWNMSRVSSLSQFAYASGGGPISRNYNIASWQISSALTNMYYMFGGKNGGSGSVWQQDVGHWDVSGLDDGPYKISYWLSARNGQNPPNMATSIYDSILDVTDGWGSQTGTAGFPTNISWQNGTSEYTANTGPATTGNTTLASGNNQTLYDNSKNFISLGIQVGDIAYNSTSGSYSKVVSVSTLSVGTDQAIWGTQGDAYSFETTNAAKGRYALIEAGWTITDGGAAPFQVQPFKFRVSVPAATSTTITVPYCTGTDYTVNWGDGSEDNNLNTNSSAVTHTYDGSVTNPEISFGKTGDTGLPTVVSFNKQGSKTAVTEITQWGNLQFTSLNYQFRECTNLTTISATDLPDWSKVTNTVGMQLMFNDAPLNSVHSSMANWDVSMMRSFNQCFGDSSGLNIDLSGWDVSGVDQANGFHNMFNGCSSLNFDAGQWTLPTHRSDYLLTGMFANCTSFNQDLSSWDILNRVTSLSSTFAGCTSFTAANLDQWDISNVTNIGTMFKNCTSITNLDVSNWNTGNVTYMLRVFEGCSNFNPDVTNWDVSRVTGNNSMQEMFENSGFNRNIAGWQLNPNMSGASEMQYMFSGSSMSTENYTDTIVGWANYVKNQNPDAPLNISMVGQSGMTFDSNRSGGTNFANAFAAREFLTNATASGGAGWTITSDTVLPLLVSSTNSLSFNGSSEYINSYGSSLLNLTSALTVSMYIRVENEENSGFRGLFTKGEINPAGYGSYSAAVINAQNNVRFYLNSGGSSSTPINITTTSGLNLDQWYHVCFTYDGSLSSNKAKIYIDGVNQNVNTSGTIPSSLYSNTSSNFHIGAYYNTSLLFEGKIDEVMIWDNVISQANITTLSDAVGSGNVPNPATLSSGVQLWNRMGD